MAICNLTACNDTGISTVSSGSTKKIKTETTKQRLLKRPVSLSLDDAQLSRIDARAAQTCMNRSSQIQRDLSAYWFILNEGMRLLQKTLTLEDVRYIASIFKGRLLPASDDIIWCNGHLAEYIRDSALYGDPRLASQLAQKIDASHPFSLLALMDWIRRAAVHVHDETLFEGWSPQTTAAV